MLSVREVRSEEQVEGTERTGPRNILRNPEQFVSEFLKRLREPKLGNILISIKKHSRALYQLEQ